jgi:hypothetical protein
VPLESGDHKVQAAISICPQQSLEMPTTPVDDRKRSFADRGDSWTPK